ncbi:MAG: type II toxin-antitoxin system Phd/YefM family antitoxin [Acidobacteria bacterium]|jgi:prevent-host-death family protein|nr:type II toxin-antitoxin system Phd/YefM family antitoxin [Acidobacteriota bacterium]
MQEIITASQAKDKIQSLIDETAESHRPILITAEPHNAVLLSEEDWKALQETLHLLSVSGMRESIVEGLNSSDDEFLSEEEFLTELERENVN